MFFAIFRYELRYWLGNPSIYVYFFAFLLLATGTMAGAAGWFGEGSANETSIANAPMQLYAYLVFFNKLLLFLLPTVLGNAVYRDFKSNIHGILYTYPFSKADYLFGKFLSAWLVVCMLAATPCLGLYIGTCLPGVNGALLVPFEAGVYLHLYGVYLLPNLLVFGVLVFAIATFYRNVYAGFIAVVVLLMLRMTLSSLVQADTWGWLVDPFGETATEYYSQPQSVGEAGALPSLFEPFILYNRLFWSILAGLAFAHSYHRFAFRQDLALKQNVLERLQNKLGGFHLSLPKLQLPSMGSHPLQTAWTLSNTDFRYIATSGPFISMLVAGTLFITVLLSQINPPHGMSLLPVTWVMLAFPVFFFSFLVHLLTFFYAGVLIQRPLVAKMQELVDASPVSNWVLLLSKWLALLKMQVLLLCLLMAAGVGVQAFQGHGRFELWHYAFDLFGIQLVGFVLWAAAALLVQTLFTNPYLGLFCLILGYLGLTELPNVGINSLLLRFNQNPGPGFSPKYSDLSGYGHALTAYFLYKAYWSWFWGLLFVATLLFWQRGMPLSFWERCRLAIARLDRRLSHVLLFCSCGLVGMGLYLHRGENDPAGKRHTSKEENALMAQFQQTFGHYAHTEQPRITAVFIRMDIFPESAAFRSEGRYTLVNKCPHPIDTLLVKAGYDEITEYTFDRAARKIDESAAFQFTVFHLAQSLAPGDSLTLHFKVKNKPNSLLWENSPVLRSGTFIRQDVFPRLGYFANTEKSLPSDTAALGNHYQAIDSDLIDFETVVSTTSDQKAIAPGYLQREWQSNGRRYFHYKMDRKIKFAFGFNSGNYAEAQDSAHGVGLRIFYHPEHPYCLAPMLRGLKASLAYNTRHFGPYPHRNAQIIEFSLAAGTFATTAANCIPMSEIRFIANTQKAQAGNMDMAFYVAAHELSHQWWGNQLIPGDALGALMLTESVAEYLTANIYAEQYGKAQAERFIRLQLERYLNGRATDTRPERALQFVHPNQQYLAYGKGAFVLYTLGDYIGEARLNGALKMCLQKAQNQGPPYTSALDLVRCLRQATPDSLQYLIRDLFETVTFYEHKMLSAQKIHIDNEQYLVNLEFLVKKYRIDEKGNKVYVEGDRPGLSYQAPTSTAPDWSLPLNDYLEIGVLDKDKRVLYLQRHKITQIYNKMSIVVEGNPAEAGVDPFVKFIDAHPNDNKKAVSNL